MQLAKVKNVENQEKSVILTLEIDGELEAFEGHFDEASILPGVIQIGWALAYSKQYCEVAESSLVIEMKALKFQQVIMPGNEVTLKLEVKDNTLSFYYESVDKRHSSGKLTIG